MAKRGGFISFGDVASSGASSQDHSSNMLTSPVYTGSSESIAQLSKKLTKNSPTTRQKALVDLVAILGAPEAEKDKTLTIEFLVSARDIYLNKGLLCSLVKWLGYNWHGTEWYIASLTWLVLLYHAHIHHNTLTPKNLLSACISSVYLSFFLIIFVRSFVPLSPTSASSTSGCGTITTGRSGRTYSSSCR